MIIILSCSLLFLQEKRRQQRTAGDPSADSTRPRSVGRKYRPPKYVYMAEQGQLSGEQLTRLYKRSELQKLFDQYAPNANARATMTEDGGLTSVGDFTEVENIRQELMPGGAT